MEYFIPISYLNDFIFCPYSVYLHQVFDNSSEDIFSSLPQQKGKSAHQIIDNSEDIGSSSILKGIYIISKNLRVYGKIDTFYKDRKKLVESKFMISKLYQGYIYQIYAQYFALNEMGFLVEEISFFSVKDRKTIKIELPGEKEFSELENHVQNIIDFDFNSKIKVNQNKCKHCIYCNLCDKTSLQHVYS
jgi:CRISPR-associated exonuclease Cas4